MEAFEKFNGLVALLDRADVDTDQIIPKQFLKRVERTGFGIFLFNDWRFDDEGAPNPAFALNQPRYKGAEVLIARENFGCGSSREHAPWSLMDFGFRAIIAPSFSDIFHTNCLKNGLLPIVLATEAMDDLFIRVEANPGYKLEVDLENQTLTGSDGHTFSHHIDPYHKHCLLNGLDDIGLSLEIEHDIDAYEQAHDRAWQAAVPKQG